LKIAIPNFQISNLRSIKHKLEQLGYEIIVAESEQQLRLADLIVFPGVGHFSAAMSKIYSSNLLDGLNEHVLVKKKPIIGICLGMQLFSKFSEEGDTVGLNWIDAETKKIKFDESLNLKVPNVGWSKVIWEKNNALDIDESLYFYFTHSYHLVCNNKADKIGFIDHGFPITAAIHHENIAGFQFHPEKSHIEGIKLLKSTIDFFCK
jgi:glutamine amidotransferase